MFTPHGDHSFRIKDSILINYPMGQFNIEGVDLAWSKILDAIEKKGLKRWYLIEYLSKDVIGTYETLDALMKYYTISRNRGCQKFFLVSECSEIEKKKVMDAFKKADITVEIVDSLENAIATIDLLEKS